MNLKILLFGPSLSGKGTILSTIASLNKVKPTFSSHRKELPELVDAQIMSIELNKNAFKIELITLTGATYGDSVWDHFLDKMSALVFVFDSQKSMIEQNIKFARIATKIHNIPTHGMIIFTKQDLVTKFIVPSKITAIFQNTKVSKWPIYLIRDDRKPYIAECFEALIDEICKYNS